VLIISPHRACEYFVGNLDLEKVKFTPETHGILDAGDAYASNISKDAQGHNPVALGTHEHSAGPRMEQRDGNAPHSVDWSGRVSATGSAGGVYETSRCSENVSEWSSRRDTDGAGRRCR